ncbi:hypothetical protein [Alicyclobacillus fastidiosus]|uniref:Pre-toxin TG domain-containing protein n=1 Tax=Alicyclobacillus fastidiosus TaxID=392011 RepID=A0ABV5AEN6_9BACL|nr:hypothetical protein [Alicyclobacillus fastidiosus]WEH09532.1 hypothetical protein PYS47_23320 [Alicyclobacillus fastidiosus]
MTKPSTGELLTTDTQPTQEQMGYAYVFLNDLKSNKRLKQEWDERLSKVNDPKYKIDDKVSYLDNFLADNGYNTTAEAVLTLLKTPWWNDYIASRQPNKQSDRFVQDLLQDPSLYKEWGQVISDTADAGDLSKADAFLKDNGYDCTAIQVNASFEKMRDQNLNFWTNLYGKTVLQKDGEDAQLGPSVIVYGDSTVSVGPDKLFGFTYEDGTISWTTDGKGGLLTNPHSGAITFSQINQPKSKDDYVGPLFSGTITFPAGTNPKWSGTYSFVGKQGDPPENSQGNVYSPPSVDKGWVGELADTLAPYVLIGFAISMVYGVFAKFGGEAWLKTKFESLKATIKEKVNSISEKNAEVPRDQFSDSTTVKQLEEAQRTTTDPAERAEIDREITKQKQLEEQKFKESEEDLTEGSSTTDDLTKVIEEDL